MDAIVQTLAEALRQRLKSDDLEAALDFVQAYAPLKPQQLLQLDQKVHILAKKERILAAPMPALINPFIELGKLKGRQEGWMEGRVKGRVEGRQEGRVEGEYALVERLLHRKFPRLAKRAKPLLRQLREEDVLAFGEALLFMESDSECLTWLNSRRKA